MQKITPFLWFNNQAEEAANYYISVFSTLPDVSDSKIFLTSRYGDTGPGPKGSVMTVSFLLNGQEFIALNGGPEFNFTPAISFFVNCMSEQQINILWEKFSDGSKVLMPLDKYPFAEKFGWIQDKYGLSWQLFLNNSSLKITPFFTFVGDQFGRTEEAIKFYTSIFPDSGVLNIALTGPGDNEPEGTIKHALFSLNKQNFMAMESSLGHDFTFSPAVSFFVKCKDQKEIDAYWEKLSEGGREIDCGWVQDKFGVSWQIDPERMIEMISDNRMHISQNVMKAMMKMKKLDLKKLEEAYQED